MKPDNFFSKAAKSILFVLCLAVSVSQADAEVKIDSVSQTVGVMGKNMEVTLTGQGFTENTKVVMMPDYGNRKAIVGSVDTPGYAMDVKVIDGKAYVADGDKGLQIIDVSDPKSPQIIGSVDTPGLASGVFILGNYAYVADGSGGLQIIDVSKPENPKIIGNGVDTPGYADRISVSGNYAYVADGSGGLQIIDVSKPESPMIITSVDMPKGYNANGISVSGNYAYVATGLAFFGGLKIINISKPGSPKVMSTVFMLGCSDVFVSGNYAYVATLNGLEIIDVSSPENPKTIGSGVDTPGFTNGLTVSDNYAYVTDGNGGLQIIDVRNPESLKIIASVATSGYARSVSVFGNYAYVAAGDGGLQITDGTKSESLKIIASVATLGYAEDVFVSDNYAYVAAWDSGLQIVDVSKPESPKIIGSVAISGYAQGVSVSDNYAYVAAREGGLQIADVSKPESPKIIGSIAGYAYDVSVFGNYAYVARDGVLQIIDVSNPESPKIIDSFTTYTFVVSRDYAHVAVRDGDSGLPYNNVVSVSGNYAYMADRSGLQIIDVSKPESIDSKCSVAIPGSPNGVSVSGNYVYVSAGEGGLQITDVNKPENPKIIAFVVTPNDAFDVFVSGNYAYVAGRSELQIIDVREPESPKIIASVATPGFAANGVFVSGNYAYVANGWDGLQILSIPVDIKPIAFTNNKQISVILPVPEITGNYSLFAYHTDTDEKVYEFAGAVEFVQPENAGILKSKAIIVAGGGNSADNKIWEETKKYADLAYKALRYQGYTEDNILYLSSEYTDNVNMDALKKNLQYAIQQWAVKDNPPDLLIYFVGHGIENQFILNSAYNEKITADELNNWLNSLQQSLNIRVTFIYDACQSGSFIPKLKAPQEKERIIITSASADEPAYFTGETAFSYLFWSTVYGKTARRVDLYSAFNFAQERIGKTQTPLIEANGNDIHNEPQDKEKLQTDIGRNYYDFNTKIPKITEASATLQTATAGIITASVSAEGIDSVKVWAEITAPDQLPPSPDIAVTDIPRIGLTDIGEGTFSLSYDKFDVNGTYTIKVYAINTDNNIPSAPKYLSITQTQRKDLSAPDLYESDDNFQQAKRIVINGIYPQQHNFHKPGDEDWVKFNGISKAVYTLKVSNKSLFCDPKIEVFYADGVSKPDCTQSQDDNQSVSCTIPADGVYYVKLSNAKPEIFGAAIRYDLQVYQPSAGGFHGYFTGTLLNNFGSPIAGAGIVTNGGGSDVTDQYGHFTIVQKAGTFTVTPFAPGYASVSYPNQVIKEDQTSDIMLKLEAGNCLDPPTAKIVSPSATTIINKGQSVNFQGTVTGGKAPFEYLWYFGGAPNSDKQNPGNVVFDKPDNPDDVNIFYPVLYVKDADGCVGKSPPVTVKVNYIAPQPEEDSGGGGCFIRSVSRQ